jgi:hypothetical protein
MNRRTWMRLVGLASLPLVAGGTGSAAVEYRGVQFDQVVDLVEDYGADPTGSEPVDSALEAAASADTLVEVPDGEYLFSGEVLLSPSGNVGIVAKDGASPRFVAPDGFNDYLLNIYHLPKAVFEGIDIDITTSDTTAGLRFDIDEAFHVQDVEFLGRGTHPDSSVVSALVLTLVNSSGTGTVRNVRALEGSAIGHYKSGGGRIGAYVGSGTKGTVRFEQCRFEEFGNNGLYCGRTPGNVQVVGGTYRNNNVAQVRIAGDGSYVTDATVAVDLDTYTGPTTLQESAYNTRGVVIDAGDIQQPPGVLVKNCDVSLANADRSAGAVCVVDWQTTVDQKLFVEDTTITVDSDHRAIYSDGGPVEVSGSDISGTADGGEAVLLNGDLASGSSIDLGCIEQPGTSRDGVCADGATSVTVSDSNVNVTGTAIVESNGGEITTSNVTYDESCTDSGPAVSTDAVSGVTESSATLNGTLSDLGGASSADVAFEWREVGASSWNTTSAQTLSSTGSFSADLSGLASGTDHEYRAVADASDEDTDTGGTGSFTTDAATSDTALTVDQYRVTEAGSPNPHVEITADWDVGDADRDLDTVTVEVIDTDTGSVVDAASQSVSGTDASGTMTFKRKHSAGKRYDVRLTLTGAAGNTASAVETVSG